MRDVILLGVLALAPVAALAQSAAGFGAITGSVRDSSGATIPDADVVISNASKGIQRNLKTNEAGLFAAGSLVPDGNYTVLITKPGFTG